MGGAGSACFKVYPWGDFCALLFFPESETKAYEARCNNYIDKYTLGIDFFCLPQTQAKDICLTLAQAFEAVHNKIKFEQNLPRSEPR